MINAYFTIMAILLILTLLQYVFNTNIDYTQQKQVLLWYTWKKQRKHKILFTLK